MTLLIGDTGGQRIGVQCNRGRSIHLFRFSNVSDAVSRKLSTTLGWRTVSIGEVVTQAKSLCGQHIRAWLKRRGLFTRKLGLQRLRSLASLPGGLAVCDVFVQLEVRE